MYESIGSDYKLRYVKEIWNSHTGQLEQLATIELWKLHPSGEGSKLLFWDFEAKAIYKKLESLEKEAQRLVFISNVWSNAGF